MARQTRPTAPVRTEDEIRDYLSLNLELIEPGLVLLNKEGYLPNDNGAAGVVDIFARSESGQLVIIEIKKGDAAARQAIRSFQNTPRCSTKLKRVFEGDASFEIISVRQIRVGMLRLCQFSWRKSGRDQTAAIWDKGFQAFLNAPVELQVVLKQVQAAKILSFPSGV